MQKGQTVVLILVGVLITSFMIGGAYYLGKSSASPKSLPNTMVKAEISPSPTSDVTTNWTTYTNRELGYALKYPNNFKITAEIKDIPPSVINNLYLDDNPNAISGASKIRVLVGKDIQSEIKSLNYLDNGGNFRGSFEKLSEIKINNLDIVKGWIIDESHGILSREYAALIPLSKDYSLTIRGKVGYEEIIDKIVSTFKLL